MGQHGGMSRRRFLQSAGVAAARLAATRLAGSGRAGAPPSMRRVVLPPGTRPDPSRPVGVDTMPQVDHVIIYMQENRSFDHYFGMLGRGDGFTLDGTGRPTNSNPDVHGTPVKVFP